MRLSDSLLKDRDFSHAVILYAEPQIDKCKADPHRTYAINVASTRRVIDDLVARDVKPIFISSEYVFDGYKGDYSEEDHTNPNTVYGSHKVEIERYLEKNCRDYAVLRLAKVFGTDPEDGSILGGWLNQIRKGEEILCARDQVYSPVHVDDVVAVTDAVISGNLSGIYHVANTQPWSRLEMLRTLLHSLGAEANVVECNLDEFTFLDNRPLNVSLNSHKITSATGLTFRTVPSCCDEFASRCSV